MNDKSLYKIVAGFVLGIICATTIAATVQKKNPVNRFKLVSAHTSIYMVDTMTGEVWYQTSRNFKGPKIKIQE